MRSLIVGALLAVAAPSIDAQSIICGTYSREVPAAINSTPKQVGPLRLELGMDEKQQPYLRATLDGSIDALPGEGYVRDVVIEHSRYDTTRDRMVVLQRESIYGNTPLEQGLVLGTIPLVIRTPLQSEKIWDPATTSDITVTYSLSDAAVLPEEMRGKDIKATLQYTPAFMRLECNCSTKN